MSTSPLLTILLPVRDGAGDLPAFLDSASRYADAVVALDDGSADDTRAILAAHPLVKVLLANPRRASYAGWDDAANRNALLEAAGGIGPRWLLSLDADERIDGDDGAALREFLETDALPGLAFSFQHFSMQGQGGRYIPTALWVHRLFHYEPGQRFPAKRLHFAPIPLSIPRSAYIRTSFRIQHLGGMSAERRRDRYEKYRQADPDCRYWPDYTSLLRETPDEELADWRPRPPGTSPFFDASEAGTVSGDDTTMSVIVPPGHPALATEGDGVEWIVADAPRSLLDRRLVERATGSVILALGEGLVPEPGALRRLADDHAAGYALVAPVVEAWPGDGWEARLAQLRYAPTRQLPGGALLDLPPVWCSFRRSLLLETLGEDPPSTVLALQHRLHRNGFLCLQSEARFRAVPAGRPLGLAALAGAFAAGRDGESSVLDAHRLAGRRLRPRRRPTGAETLGRRSRRGDLPLPLEVARSAGRVYELARPAPGKVSLLFGRPQLNALWIVTHGDRRRLLVVSWSRAKRSVRVLRVPRALEVERPDGTWVALGDAIPATGRIPRFVLHELVGRPFSVPVRAYVRLDLGDRDPPPSDVFRSTLGPTLRGLRTVDASLDRPSLAIFLAAAARSTIDEIAPWEDGSGGRLDADTAEMVARFFSGHTALDLGNSWERQRLVAWA